MPTYEYACAACKNEWEVEQRISAEPIKKCPKCGKNKARRLIGSGNFILKGGGWYSDLYSSAGNKPPAAKKTESSETSKSETSSSTSETSSSSEPAKPAKEAAPDPKPKKKTKSD
jgi:putative FmdB family regulatory protein